MLEQRGFNLSCGQTMPRDIDNIIHPPTDPVVALVIAGSAIARELALGQYAPCPECGLLT